VIGACIGGALTSPAAALAAQEPTQRPFTMALVDIDEKWS
jgi:poly(3-hydroxyalkanoate) synthetase